MRLYKTKKSKIDNLGLYAARDIKKGTKIIEYKGKVITRKEAEENPKYDNDKAIYLFNLNKRFDLDGDFKFNTARLINQSCNPNCEAIEGDKSEIWITAKKNIKKNEELSYDYGFEFDEDDYSDHVCKCGSKKCIGYVISSDDWKKFKKFKNKKKI